MATLSELAAELALLVPAVNGAPTSNQYTAAVHDAARDFGQRVPRLLQGALSVVAGTAAYDLPAGFQRLVHLEPLGGGARRNPAGFLVVPPLIADETYTVAGGQITFYPTPGYTLDRAIRYAAGYPHDAGSGAFTGLTADAERVVLLKAQANALRSLSVATGGAGGLTYSIGDTSVQRALTSPYSGLADDLNKQYLDACRALRGFVGRLSSGSYEKT